MKAIYKVGYFLILITVLIPISVDYVMQGGLAAGWLAWFAADMAQAVLLYRVSMLILQLGTFTGCVLFFRSYVPEKNGGLLTLMGTALYMLNPIRFYVCYDLVDFALAFVLMLLPLIGWIVLKAGEQWKKKSAGSAGYFALGLFGVALLIAVITLDPVKADFEMLRERYYIGDMFRAFIYRTGHPGFGLGLMMAIGLYGWWILVGKNKMKKSEIAILLVAMSGLIAAGCDQSRIYGPLLAMTVGTGCLILLVTGRDYAAGDDVECKACRLWIYGTIAACLAVGTYICNMLMYYRAPLD